MGFIFNAGTDYGVDALKKCTVANATDNIVGNLTFNINFYNRK